MTNFLKKVIVTLLIIFAFTLCQSAFAQVPSTTADTSTTPIEEVVKYEDKNILGIDNQKLKSGDVRLDDIPVIIASLIKFGIGVAGTISIVMLIYFSVQMQLKSGIMGDTTGVERAKKWMFAAAVGFVLAISAWFIMARVIDLLAQVSS